MKRYDHSTSWHDHKHLLQRRRLLKVLNGGPTKASWFPFHVDPLFWSICFFRSAI
jgi:hypothetical protein